MKLLFLVACIGLAASASLRLPSGQLTARTPRELTYQYDTQVATGIEEVSNDFSTLRMRVRVQMRTSGAIDGETGAEKWTLAFREVSLRQRNNATERLPKSLLPMEEFRNLESPELWSQIERALQQPFAVLLRPNELSVAKVLFSETDPFWSVNIKKGFVSLLQVNFIPTDASAATFERGQWTKETDEMTVAATCKAFYSASKIDFHESDSPVYRVDKAIDFNSCLNPVDGTRGLAGMWNGMRHQEQLPGQESQDLVSVNNMAQYLVDMGGSDRASPVIRKASARTVHILSPSSDSTHGSERIFSVQKLKLLSGDASDAASEEIAGSGPLTEQPEGLRLIFPAEAKNVDREALTREVVQLFRRSLWQADTQEVDMRTYEQIVRILRLHLKRTEDLESIARQLASQPNGQRSLRAFIMDICPQVATHGSIQFLMRIVQALAKTGRSMELVEQAQLNVHHIPAIFAKLSMTSKIQLRTLQAVFEVVKAEAFRSRLMTAEGMPIFSSAWLSLGAMVNVYFGRQGGVEPYLQPLVDTEAPASAPWEIRRSQAARSEEFRRQFIAEVTDGLKRTDAGRSLALKVTKNCGLFELYDQIGPMIRQRDTRAIAERVQAAYATQNMLRRNTLARITVEEPRSVPQEEKHLRDAGEYARHFERTSSRIQSDLVACFRNVREDPELRIACYRVLMQCPSVKQSVLNMLVQAILSEPTQQVYSYCANHMAEVAGSNLPRYHRVRQTVHSALSMLQRREPIDQSYSRVFHGQLWDELHKLGLTIETDMIVSDKSFVPRWTHIRFDHQAMGQNMPLLEIGLRTQGLQSLLEKLFGPRGLIYKSDNFVQLLRRAARSLDASIDSELLDILPRVMEEMPNMDLTVGLMGYDVIYVKNSRNIASSPKRLDSKAAWKWLSSFSKVLKPFTGLFSISANYELPTPAGTILDLNCFMTLDFWPKVTVQKEVSDSKTRLHVKASLPIVIKGYKRFGSNMHVLNHFNQWLSSAKINQQSSQELVIQVDLANPSHSIFSFLLAASGVRTPIVQFKNAVYSTMTESVFQEGTIRTINKNRTVVHRQMDRQRSVDYQPLLSNLLAPFGYKLQVKGKHFSTMNLYQAPCSLLTGPSEFTVFLQPTTAEETSRTVFISSRLEVTFSDETAEARLQQVKLQVNNVRIQSDGSESIRQKLVSATFQPKEWTADRATFQCSLRYHLALPSSYRANGYQLTVNGQIEMPEDLRMTPKSRPLQSEEWFADRRLRVSLRIADEEAEVASIDIERSANPELKKLLVQSDLPESQMKKMFPRLADCLNESRKSIQEEPLNANPLFTPSCISQFKQFNKLSQTKIEINRRASWFANPRNSPMLDAAIGKFQDIFESYLVSSEASQASEDKITIVSRPSPVDMRVNHLNITCPSRKNIWRSIQLPSVPFFWSGVDPIVTAAKDYVKGGVSKCSLLHSHIRTFDNVIYSMPQSLFSQIAENQCPILLAKDCSNEKEFQVLAQIKDGKKVITLSLNTQGSRPFVVEVSKQLNADQAKSSVRVNGAEVDQSEESREETEIMRRSVNTEKGPVTVVVSKYQYAGTTMYRIASVQHQVEVLVGGRKLRTVEVRVSPFYRNRICGLCGDYNAEKFREFKGPNYHRVMASAKSMVQQYVLPVSDSCRMDRPDSSRADSQFYLPNHYSYKSFDLPERRPSCQIVDDKRVKTFKHAEFDLMAPALRRIVRDTDCAAKLAVARLGESRVRIYLHSSRSEVLIKVDGSYQQRLSIASPISSERSASPLPSDLTSSLVAQQSQAVFELAKDDQRVTVKVTADRRVVIKASHIDRDEAAICEMSHPSQMAQADADSGRQFEALKKFTNAEESSICRDQLKKRINQCRVSPRRVQPFHRAGESSWWQPRYLNAELQSRLADTQAPLILSVDQIAEEAAAHSVQLVLERSSAGSERLMRHILLKKNRQTLVKISMPEADASDASSSAPASASSVRIAYTHDGSERTVEADSQATRDVDGNFRLIVSNDHIRVAHKTSMYELEVQQLSSQPEVTIARPYAHPSYARAGLCQVNQLAEVRDHHENPRAVLTGTVEATLASLTEAGSSRAPILTEEEVGRINRLVGEISYQFDY